MQADCERRRKRRHVRDDFRRLAHAGLIFNAPLSEERAAALIAALPISPGHHVLDLGCGWGELLLRILASHPATTGTGVDIEKDALDRGVLTAARRGLQGRVEFVEAPAETFVDLADVVVCVAASHAFGGHANAFRWLRECVAPGGRVLFGDGYWALGPSASALAAIGELPQLEEIHEAALSSRFRVEHATSSTQAEWDTFEAAWRSGLEASSDPEAVAFAAERKREYEEGYRAAIGFAWVVLAPV